MAVSYHTNAVRSDAEDLERAAGMMSIKACSEPDSITAAVMRGASVALYALAYHDIKTAEDFWKVFRPMAFMGTEDK